MSDRVRPSTPENRVVDEAVAKIESARRKVTLATAVQIYARMVSHEAAPPFRTSTEAEEAIHAAEKFVDVATKRGLML